MLASIQQPSPGTSGAVNGKTYNPQQTQPSEIKSTNQLQDAQTVSPSTLAREIDPSLPVNNFGRSDGILGLGIYVLLPLLILFRHLYLKAKK